MIIRGRLTSLNSDPGDTSTEVWGKDDKKSCVTKHDIGLPPQMRYGHQLCGNDIICGGENAGKDCYKLNRKFALYT